MSARQNSLPQSTTGQHDRAARRRTRVGSVAGGLGVLALVTTAGVGLAPNAAAAPTKSVRVTCQQSGTITVTGASVTYRTTCATGSLTVKGVATDTADDGHCVRVQVTFADGTKQVAPACGKGDATSYKVTGHGTVGTIMIAVI